MLLFGGIGALILLVISYVYGSKLLRIKPSIDITLMKELCIKAAPFGLAYLCLAFYRQFDVTMIALLRDDFELQNAYYGFVVRMADMGFVLPTFLLNSTLPVLSERDARGEDTRVLLGKTMVMILMICTIAFLFAALWPRPLIALLTSEQYLSTALTPGSDTALRLFAVPFMLNGLIMYAFYVLLNKHIWKQLVASLFVAAIAALSLNLLWIPTLGFVGASYTSIVVHCGLAAILLPQALKVMPLTLTKSLLIQWLVFSVATATGLVLFKPLLVNDIATVIGLVAMTTVMGATVWGLKLHKSLL